MAGVPETGETPLIRTDFSNEAAWEQLVEAAKTPSGEGFLANLNFIDQAEFRDADAQELGKLAADTNHAVLFVADAMTMNHPEHPLLCVDLFAPERTFRVIPSALWSAENNLSLGNMDFEEFADAAAGIDGIFRGYSGL